MEWLNKRETAIKEAIGNEADDMLYLGSLATAPSKQGRGYGARLVGSLTAEVCRPLLLFFYTRELTLYPRLMLKVVQYGCALPIRTTLVFMNVVDFLQLTSSFWAETTLHGSSLL